MATLLDWWGYRESCGRLSRCIIDGAMEKLYNVLGSVFFFIVGCLTSSASSSWSSAAAQLLLSPPPWLFIHKKKKNCFVRHRGGGSRERRGSYYWSTKTPTGEKDTPNKRQRKDTNTHIQNHTISLDVLAVRFLSKMPWNNVLIRVSKNTAGKGNIRHGCCSCLCNHRVCKHSFPHHLLLLFSPGGTDRCSLIPVALLLPQNVHMQQWHIGTSLYCLLV